MKAERYQMLKLRKISLYKVELSPYVKKMENNNILQFSYG